MQRFAVPGFWSFPEERALRTESFDWAVLDALTVPKSESRRGPLGIPYPGVVRQRMVIEFPEDVIQQGNLQRYNEGDARVSLQGSVESTRNRFESRTEVRFAVEQIEAQDWTAHVAQIAKIASRLGRTATISAVPLARQAALDRELKQTDASIRERRAKSSRRSKPRRCSRSRCSRRRSTESACRHRCWRKP